ncbi:DUF2017 domain-containing protein [Rhodococcus sp. HNM0563]|uniref:oxidative stress transcriptional regulator AosR n=1 Tax=unclassified Rhodococcus (in: high G+C Gram-positive bacteria) TaxID=192944 RepID=UPI00146AA573|nr:DUF2017 domain-containing protein [Rhodococcus sp. F64268]MCK0092304.1 DUF2017 domain-containing protein [Rhodococcus sp. F64268]NLU63050.1 DUF2017 domain-containing protein [Rhodococcus sp. HNM0563]
MRQWTRKNSLSGPKLRSEMDGHEASVLRSLVASVLGMLEDRSAQAPQDDLAELTGLRTGNSTPPEIPALERLLPDFHRPDADAEVNPDDEAGDLNGALRSLHEPSIIDAKLAAGAVILRTVPEDGGKVVLNPEQAEAWLYGLNDVRLALGTTLGIDADTPETLDDDDPRAPHLDVYHWLTWMQDSLVQALLP